MALSSSSSKEVEPSLKRQRQEGPFALHQDHWLSLSYISAQEAGAVMVLFGYQGMLGSLALTLCPMRGCHGALSGIPLFFSEGGWLGKLDLLDRRHSRILPSHHRV